MFVALKCQLFRNYLIMSWETVSESSMPCPCGKGTYIITISSDDWGRSEEHWIMECPFCKENYTLEVKHITDRDGMPDEIRSWKSK